MDFATSSDVGSDDVSVTETKRTSKTIDARAFDVKTDRSRDALLTEFGKDTLHDRYLLPGETYQDLFARVASAYADDAGACPARLRLYLQAVVHAGDPGAVERRHRPRPADQLLSEQRRRQPRRHRRHLERECLAGLASGGGIGTYWGAVRGIGEPVGLNGKTSGIIPFVRVMDSLTLAISQGSLRRGSAACYLDIAHPEIEEFLEIRKPSGDFNRKALNLHHGVLVTDEFMEAVRDGAEFMLRSPQRRLGARQGRRPLAVPEAGRDPARDRRALHHLHRPGEPVDAQASPRPRPQGHRPPTCAARSRFRPARDHLGADRTAVCCLSSLSLETWDEWNGDKQFIEDVMRFLDNVLSDYIARAPDEMARAKYSAPSASARSASA